ncbi:hypothetical protein AeNC1_008982 [Aphanomyces euteiches]|nr:hypothetical protein AeNC1_008982 [Aphanomyces euteiches]
MERTPRAEGYNGSFAPSSPLQRSHSMSPTHHTHLPNASLSPMGSLTARRDADQKRAKDAGISLLGLAFGNGGPVSAPTQAVTSPVYYGHPETAVYDVIAPPLEGVDPNLFMEGVKEHAKYLGMNPQRDAEFLWIARESLVAPVPSGWHQVVTKEGAPYYYNDHTGESRWEHPCDRVYMDLFQQVKRMKEAGEHIDVHRLKQELQQRQTLGAWVQEDSYEISTDDGYSITPAWTEETSSTAYPDSDNGASYGDAGRTTNADYSDVHSGLQEETPKSEHYASIPQDQHRELVESLYSELNECKRKLELQREHQDVVESLQRKVLDFQTKLEAQADETRNREKTSKELQDVAQKAKEDKEASMTKIEDMENMLKQLRQQLDFSNGELELSKSRSAQENVTLRQEVKTLELRLKDMEQSNSVQEIEKQLTKERKLKFQWEQKYKLLEEQHQALMIQVDNSNRKYEMDRHASQGDVEKYQKELELHRSKVEIELKESNEKHLQEIESLNQTLKTQYTEEIASITAKHKEVENSLKEAAQQRENELISQLRAVEAELLTQTAALTDAKAQLQTLRKEATQTHSRYQQLETKDAEHQKLISLLQNELRDLRSGFQVELEKAKQLGIDEANASSQAKVQAAIAEKDQLAQLYAQELKARRQLHNKVMEMAGNIRVFCRVRPVSAIELKSDEAAEVVTFRPNDAQVLDLTMGEGQKHTFEFDYVFQPSSAQIDVFEQTKSLVVSAMDGFNVCIFAYGQTGSGKTHTMEGPATDRGVNFRAMEELFRVRDERMLSGNFECDMKLSILEVYNETIVDLLDDSQPTGERKGLEVRMGKQGAFVENLMEVEVFSTSDVEDLMKLGHSHRSVGSHDVNEHSSRSHLVLSITITTVQKLDGKKAVSKLHLIDLAGSERISKTAASGQRLKEAQHINRSLSALGDVIASLGGHSKHVPYRNSKLTFLLQESLSGNSKVLMFVNVSPVQWNAWESLCSLNFAQRCRNVALGQAKSSHATPPASSAPPLSSSGGPSSASKQSKSPANKPTNTLTATEKVRVSLAPPKSPPRKDH